MKKLVKNRFMSLIVCLAMVFTMMAVPVQALAANANTDVQNKVAEVEQNAIAEMEADIADTAEPTSIEPRTHVSYYPYSGVNSGHFYGAYGPTAVYRNLPYGTMKFSYSMSGGQSQSCYLLFYRGENVNGTSIRSVALNANDYTGAASVYLPVGGSYTVQVYYPNGNANTDLYYAFNLYRD